MTETTLTVRRAPRTTAEHITGWDELRRHVEHPAKRLAYDRLLLGLGVDPDRLAGLRRDPRIVFAEQPGSWLYPDDVGRHRLLAAIRDSGLFAAGSGAFALDTDAFGHRGMKRYLMRFDLGCGLGPVNLLGSPFLRRHQGRVYSSLRLEGSACERLEAVFGTCDRLLSAAAHSAAALSREASDLLDAGVLPGLRPLLPARRDRDSLRRLARRLRLADLERALGPLRVARQALADGVPWPELWRRVNGDLLGVPIGDLSPLFNRLLLAVEDPLALARGLGELLPGAGGGSSPLPVAGIVPEEDRYRMVFFDPREREFFYRSASGRHHGIAWQRVRELARAGRAGGLAAVPSYLLMAAAGVYLVADPRDGTSPFERRVATIHRRHVGLKYPWVSLRRPLVTGAGCYLDLFRRGFETRCHQILAEFRTRRDPGANHE